MIDENNQQGQYAARVDRQKMSRRERAIRIGFGTMALTASPVLPYFFYVGSEGAESFQSGLLIQLSVAALASFIIFSLALDSDLNAPQRFVAGGCFSYVAFALLLALTSFVSGVADEMLMWSVVVIAFGIPYTAPLILLTWLAAEAMFGKSISRWHDRSDRTRES